MMKEKTSLLYKIVCFKIGIKGFWLEVFYYFSEKLTQKLKLRYARGSRFSQIFYTINSSPLLCYQVSNIYIGYM